MDLPEDAGADPEPMLSHLDVDTVGTAPCPTVDHQTRIDDRRVDQDPPTGLHRDQSRPPTGGGGHLDVVGPSPQGPTDPDLVELVGGQRTTRHRLDVVGPVPVESHLAGAIDGEAHPGPPSQSVGSAGHLLDHHCPVDPGQPPELFDHQILLQLPLGREGNVLPVAPPAPTGTGQWTGRLDPVDRRLEHLDGIGTQERGGLRGDLGHDPLSGQGVTDEHHSSVSGPGHATAAGRDGTGHEFDAYGQRAGFRPGPRPRASEGPLARGRPGWRSDRAAIMDPGHSTARHR